MAQTAGLPTLTSLAALALLPGSMQHTALAAVVGSQLEWVHRSNGRTSVATRRPTSQLTSLATNISSTTGTTGATGSRRSTLFVARKENHYYYNHNISSARRQSTLRVKHGRTLVPGSTHVAYAERQPRTVYDLINSTADALSLSTRSRNNQNDVANSVEKHYGSGTSSMVKMAATVLNKVHRRTQALEATRKEHSVLDIPLAVAGVGPGGRFRRVRTTWQRGDDQQHNYHQSYNQNYQGSGGRDDLSMFQSTVQRMKHPVLTPTLVCALAIVAVNMYCLQWDASENSQVYTTSLNDSPFVRIIRSSFAGTGFESSSIVMTAQTYGPVGFAAMKPVFVLNALVYLGFWVRPAFMGRHFIHYPLSGKTYTLFTSFFAHATLLHIYFNMLTLNYMLRSTVTHMTVPHIYATYLTAGIFSSWLSHVVMLGRFRFLNVIPMPSLGASGAVYSLVAMYGLTFPMQLTTLPFMEDIFTCYAINMVKVMVAGELIGSFFPSSAINHVAHLGGAISGYISHKGKEAWRSIVRDAVQTS